MKDLDVFIPGETIDLCIPTEEFARDSEWYSWFNRPKITRYLEQGLFPNTRDGQVDFFRSQQSGRLILIISDKNRYMGVISLSGLNLVKRIADIAMVVDTSKNREMSRFISLESMARMTEHAFNALGLNRVQAGQHRDLSDWQQRLELIGYRLEGLHKAKFAKGPEVTEAVSIACTYADYRDIISRRGVLWDSWEMMKKRFERLPEKKFVETLRDFMDHEGEDYYRKVFSL